jgi:hypothetical protein
MAFVTCYFSHLVKFVSRLTSFTLFSEFQYKKSHSPLFFIACTEFIHVSLPYHRCSGLINIGWPHLPIFYRHAQRNVCSKVAIDDGNIQPCFLVQIISHNSRSMTESRDLWISIAVIKCPRPCKAIMARSCFRNSDIFDRFLLPGQYKYQLE